MSIERKLRRQSARKQSTSNEGSKKMSDKAKEAAEFEHQERNFSKPQMRQYNELQKDIESAQKDVETAQKALQKFTNYLGEEHEIGEVTLPEGIVWGLGPKGFKTMAEPNQPPSPPSSTPPNGSGEGAPPSDGSGEGPAPQE